LIEIDEVWSVGITDKLEKKIELGLLWPTAEDMKMPRFPFVDFPGW